YRQGDHEKYDDILHHLFKYVLISCKQGNNLQTNSEKEAPEMNLPGHFRTIQPAILLKPEFYQ
ncbi:MAG: hypothetical protein WBW79_01640, partial [Desulfocapsaceae bacterium]